MRRDRILLGLALFAFAVALLLLAIGWPWGALSAAAQGGLVLLVRRKLVKERFEWEGPAPPPPVAHGVDVDEVDLSGIPEPVEACPHCGYLGIRAPTVADGGIPGTAEISDVRVCRRCGYRGLATFFETREEYRGFLKGLARGG